MVQPVYEVKTTTDIAYAVDDDAHDRRHLDIYAPNDSEDYPVLIFVSGGGWTQGNKMWVGNIGQTLAPMGIGIVAVDHRLVPEVQYDGMVDDLALAFAWVKENIAEYGGNPDQVFVGGHSAGGHIMTLLATDRSYLEQVGYTTDDIAGIVSMSSSLEISADYIENMLEAVSAYDIPSEPNIRQLADNDDKYAIGSPINHVREDLPPFLILYAEYELTEALTNQAQSMAKLLEEAGVPVELLEVKGRDHFTIGHIGTAGDETVWILCDWLFKIIRSEFGE